MGNIINITFGTLMTSLDDEVVRAVQKVGIDIDKEELLKALELYHNLVRCKDCKWATEARMKSIEGDVIVLKTCPSRTEVIEDDDFCSYGERSEE